MPARDGDYVLWLKFSEFWCYGSNKRVFDIAINDETVIKNLDIYDKVGHAVAYDEVVPFQISNGKLIINGMSKEFNNEIRIDFLKGLHENPKVNAIVLLKGKAAQIPPLPDIE